MDGVTLPDWLVAELPTVQPHGRADAAGPSSVVYVAPEGQRTSFDDVATAYETLRGVDLEFGDALLEREDGHPGMISFPSKRDGLFTMWLASNDALSWDRLSRNYAESLECAAAYHRDGESDFLAAFRYVDRHPAFWIRLGRGGSERASWFWETTGHMNRVHIAVFPDDDGILIVTLETGMHAPDMTEHYHDYYLDSAGRTFEEAVVSLARRVAVRFNDDGTETGDKPPNPWADDFLATLNARMDDLEADEYPS